MSLLLKVKNKHVGYLLLSLLSAILLSSAWQNVYFLPGIFLGLVPLLILERTIRNQEANSKLWVFVYTWLALLLWNVGSVWWIWNASPGGAIAAFIINSLPLVLPFLLYHHQNIKQQREHPMFFVALWMGAEYLQFHWDFAFPWLLLGNVFSYTPLLVQWYEVTGVLGGTFWVLMVNTKVFQYFSYYKEGTFNLMRPKLLNTIFIYGLLPLFASYYLLPDPNAVNNSRTAGMVLVQPNIDPYNDKFGGMYPVDQLRKMLLLAETAMDSQTQVIVLPETALQGGLQENSLLGEGLMQVITGFIKAHPGVSILGGMDSYRIYEAGEEPSITARKMRDLDTYYDAYNAAFLHKGTDSIQVYHKSKLVPGVEKMPYPGFFKFLGKYAIALGGTSGTLGEDKESKVFEHNSGLALAPIICYESVFSNYVASYVRKGADVLCVITNDGWWGNTPGYRQHFDFSRLRAIETRRYVVRSANTGISGVINHQGLAEQQSQWWNEQALKANIPLLSGETFYTRHGDWIAWVVFVLGWLSLRFSKFVFTQFNLGSFTRR